MPNKWLNKRAFLAGLLELKIGLVGERTYLFPPTSKVFIAMLLAYSGGPRFNLG